MQHRNSRADYEEALARWLAEVLLAKWEGDEEERQVELVDEVGCPGRPRRVIQAKTRAQIRARQQNRRLPSGRRP